MESLKIEIKTVNAAFSESPELELARILRELAKKIENGDQPTTARDLNGNKVAKLIWE